jgi:hypothetical protein
MMLRIEMNRGHGWELRAEGPVPAETSTARIEAIQCPHSALIDGIEVANVTPGG